MITVIGLGPGSLDRVPGPVLNVLTDEKQTVIARTRRHPAAGELAALRPVTFCDDLYEHADTFDDVYVAIVDRVREAAVGGPVVYAVPGSPLVGEFAVQKLVSGGGVEVIPGESFVDAVLAEVAYDPLDRGLQILNGHDLGEPLVLDKPTIIGHVDNETVLGDVVDRVSRVVSDDTTVTVIVEAGSADSKVSTTTPGDVDLSLAGFRTSLWLDPEPSGIVGAIRVMRRLREECPWDREQTHHTLVKNLIEETYELVEAISELPQDPEEDWVAYSRVEDELGDVLLQVLFHAAIARQAGGFDIDGVAAVMQEKLIRRHPHVFGDVEVEDASDVKANWDRIKAEESGVDGSTLDGVPSGLPALQRAAKIQNRAAKVGFDWDSANQVAPKLSEELAELQDAVAAGEHIDEELGDLMFTVVNLARHLGVDPELALGHANIKFERRFRKMEADGPLDRLDIDQLNERWDRAKEADRR